MPKLLTTAQAAAWLQFSAATVRDMIARGEIRAQRFGRQWRIPEESLTRPDAAPVKPHLSKQGRMELEMWEARRKTRAP